MLLAILSDIHDNLANLAKCLEWCRANQVKQLIFCGDTTTSETIAYLAVNFRGKIFVVRGNIELYDEDELAAYPNIDYRGETDVIETGGLKIGFCHEPEKVKLLLETYPTGLDFIFHGHTHRPWLEKRGATIVANPGNVANIFHQATFATLDTVTKKLALKILADL